MLLILSAVTITLTVGNNGLFSRGKIAADEHIKQEAKEAMNLKITGIQIESYTENQRLPNLQYLADKLCEDKEMEYVEKETRKQASLDKIDVTGLNSIFTKIKKYPYEFEIDSELKLASIDGVKIADNNTSNENISDKLEKIELAIKRLEENNNKLNNEILGLKQKNTELETSINNITNDKMTYTFTELGSTTATSATTVTLKDSITNYKYIMIVRKGTNKVIASSGWVPIDMYKDNEVMVRAGGDAAAVSKYVSDTKASMYTGIAGNTSILYGIK